MDATLQLVCLGLVTFHASGVT
uniref:Uncharacterized protein n=1 Tax=Arundo donax TaxID=35708 RepID=A0A0A8Y5T0_ARUDO